MNFEEQAYRYAIKNAVLHEGKADLKAVIGKLIALNPELSADLGKEVKKINSIIEQVNQMDKEEQLKEYKKFEENYELKPKPPRTGLPELDLTNLKGIIITRFAPNPNGAIHFGNARAAVLSNEYAKANDGKFYLRFDDTDPKTKKPLAFGDKMILEDLAWLGILPDKIYYASDRLELYYSYMKKTMELGKAYVCICATEEWRNKIAKKQACDCRELSIQENSERLEKMLLHEYKEGKAVLRIKTDLSHPDLSVRDWWAAKIVDNPKHPRTGSKNHVWPSYNFASAIDDHEMNITLIIRGQEHSQNVEKQKYLYEAFEWQYPKSIHYGKILSLDGMILSKSEIDKGLEQKTFFGYDDPRLGTIRALRRRGIQPKVILDTIIELGIKPVDVRVSMKAVYDKNKKIIDKYADRMIFIEEPLKLHIQFCPSMTIEKQFRPHDSESGTKLIEIEEGTTEIFISKKELENTKIGQIFRLKNAFNAKLIEKGDYEAFAEYSGRTIARGNEIEQKFIPWLKTGIDASLMKLNGEKVFGIIDEEAYSKETDDIIHLEKIGYARIDKTTDKSIELWQSHE